jgi:hypothetical protein
MAEYRIDSSIVKPPSDGSIRPILFVGSPPFPPNRPFLTSQSTGGVGVAFYKSRSGYLYLLLITGKYGDTRGIEGPVTWIDLGKDCHPPGGKLWLGRVGDPYSDQVFYG